MHALTSTRWLMALVLAVAISSTQSWPVRAQEPPAIDMEVFYDELEGAGRWYRHSDYGEVWQPDVDDEDWRPYTRGRWAYTEDHGWTWVSDEPWGWAVYHYGRWALDDEWGWIWIPGFEWAPAWVAWRESEDHIGWAPLPPEAAWDAGSGLNVGTEFYDEPRFAPYWVFVAPGYLMSSHLHRHVAPVGTNIGLIGRSRPVTRYDFVDRRIFNFGLAPNHIERRHGHAVPTSRLTITPDPAARADHGVARPDFRVYRPDMAGRPDAGARPPRPAPASVETDAPVIDPRQRDAQPQAVPGVRPGRGQQPGTPPAAQAGGAPPAAPQSQVAPTAQPPQQPGDGGPRIFRKSGQSQPQQQPQVLPAPAAQAPQPQTLPPAVAQPPAKPQVLPAPAPVSQQPQPQPAPARPQTPPVTPTVINPPPPAPVPPPQTPPRLQRPPDQPPQQPRPQAPAQVQPPAPAQPAAKPQRPPPEQLPAAGAAAPDRPGRPQGDPR